MPNHKTKVVAVATSLTICFITVGYFSFHVGKAVCKSECVERYFNSMQKWEDEQEDFIKDSIKVINCESRGKIDAIGDNGKAYSWLQYHKPTFYEHVKLSGNEDLVLDWQNPSHQFRMWRWAWKNGKWDAWTCASFKKEAGNE